jgi:hypothetical protein
MRSKLANSSGGVDFIKKQDQRHYEQMKALTLVYAEGKPERLAKIEAAKTLTAMQHVFVEMMNEEQTAPQ